MTNSTAMPHSSKNFKLFCDLGTKNTNYLFLTKTFERKVLSRATVCFQNSLPWASHFFSVVLMFWQKIVQNFQHVWKQLVCVIWVQWLLNHFIYFSVKFPIKVDLCTHATAVHEVHWILCLDSAFFFSRCLLWTTHSYPESCF